MKSVIFILVVLFFVITPVSGQSLSDATGLIDRLDVQTSGYAFEIKLTSNFDLTNYTFDKNEKQITLYFDSALENNLAEIIIPKDLLSGNFMFYLNDVTEGGETEFLYQKCRFKPEKNTLLVWPSQFTHIHRGNPPLSNDKYIITGWIEYGY